MKEKKTSENERFRKYRKRLSIAAVCLAVTLAVSIPVVAWFTKQRKLETMAKIKSPTTLNIGAGNKEDSAYIDLGGIDVEGEETSKDFVFCVYSDSAKGDYKIQLAHTTNIDFTYTIYRADSIVDSEGNNAGNVKYFSKLDNKDYYYSKGSVLVGDYLNKDNNTQLADQSKHTDTYDTYDEVQKNAEPLYWQNTSPIVPSPEGVGFVDYYILEVSWTKGEVKNDKETDMVYLTAGMI